MGTDPSNPDSDEDGLADGQEVTDPSDPEDTDEDGLIDALDEDDDGDGLWTTDELQGYDWAEADPDESPPDTDGDGTPDHLDTDSDDDGTLDSEEGMDDWDCDGIANYIDADDQSGSCDTGDTGFAGLDTGDTGLAGGEDTASDAAKDDPSRCGCTSVQGIDRLAWGLWLLVLGSLVLSRRARSGGSNGSAGPAALARTRRDLYR